MEMSAQSKDDAYENTGGIYTGLILPDNNEYSALKPTSNPIPEAQKTEEQVKPKVCPPEWIGFNTSCYYISSSRKSWNDSQEYCAERGGHLAIIHTPEEQTFLFNQLAPGYWNAYWFGVSDEKAEGDWFWVDGTKLVRGFWIDGEPNNNNDEDCGYMVKTCNASILTLGSWNDAPCNMSCPWICEAPIS
ncbi:C-type lectin domain family 17, member A-like isoform X3 [Anguilla rostrata]|uniref:C-type lectin domain family 17, member A-like isoform X2 n=1 Tax=Anguilla anguilla TaxID=7936 RepID=UPI0015AB7180|nr:C-type lectin domain family 17, member A-like isoform X2 [Anguilla anguilla]